VPSKGAPIERAAGLLAVFVDGGPHRRLPAPRPARGAQGPIVINLNVRIEQEVRVRVERDLEELLDDPELFGG
jgi:hypothetical protein